MSLETQQAGTPGEIRKSIVVDAPQAVAFRVFTERMTTWWPLQSHKIGKVAAKEAVIEPRVGGRWFERGVDGSECPWGRVLAWEPPGRLVLTWDITADWQADATLNTEVEVRFVAESATRTRVELEHRHLDRYGARQGEMVGIFTSPGGWPGLLAGFARAAAAPQA